MGSQTDTKELTGKLSRAIPLQARDALAAAAVAGVLAGPEGVAIAPTLRTIAAQELLDVERLSGRAATLGASPTIDLPSIAPPTKWREALAWLADAQRETLTSLVEAIPADADDVEGEATEHLLEHVIARKRDALELLERALR